MSKYPVGRTNSLSFEPKQAAHAVARQPSCAKPPPQGVAPKESEPHADRDDVRAPDPTKAEVQLCGRTLNTGYLSLLVLVAQNASLVLLTRWSRSITARSSEGKLYRSTSLVLTAEVLKMLTCLVLLALEKDAAVSFLHRLRQVVWSFETVKLGVPAFLFMLQNYLLFVSLSNLDAMTFQILSQIKLLLAAVFSVWLLERHLSCVQWTSVLLLTLGIILSSQGQRSEKTLNTAAQNSLLGIASCVTSGTSSAFASVYFEKILKGTRPTIAVRNIQLGIVSLVLCSVAMVAIDGVPGVDFDYFDGYTPMTWVLAALHAGGGILVAVVVKYADNILKGFATGVSIIVTGLYAAAVWGFTPSPYFILGSLVVTVGTCIYNIPDPQHPTVEKMARMMPGGHRIQQKPVLPA